MKRHLFSKWTFTILAFAFLAVGYAQQVPAPRAPSNSVEFATSRARIRVVTVATGLVHPWSIAFLPDGRTALVAEQAGRLRIIRNGVLDPKPVWEAPKAAAG